MGCKGSRVRIPPRRPSTQRARFPQGGRAFPLLCIDPQYLERNQGLSCACLMFVASRAILSKAWVVVLSGLCCATNLRQLAASVRLAGYACRQGGTGAGGGDRHAFADGCRAALASVSCMDVQYFAWRLRPLQSCTNSAQLAPAAVMSLCTGNPPSDSSSSKCDKGEPT